MEDIKSIGKEFSKLGVEAARKKFGSEYPKEMRRRSLLALKKRKAKLDAAKSMNGKS